MNYILIKETKVKVSDRKMKKKIFEHKFLIQDIFHKNEVTHLIFGKPVDKVHIEGTVSQIF